MPPTETTIEVRDPPSLNAVLYASWHKQSRIKKALQAEIEGLLMFARIPRGLDKVTATAVLAFPTNRRRDQGNYRAMLEKALGDALTNGGWLADDTPDHFTFGNLTIRQDAELDVSVARIKLRYQR